jgi:hypothetical protein
MVSGITIDTMIEKLVIDNALILKDEKVLTDTKLRNLKSMGKMYKVPDREGLYVAVTPKWAVSFRYNYSLNGRQETLTLGLFGEGGKARGFILGSIADKFKKTTGSSGRVSAEVSTMKSFNRDDCKRLNVRLTQSDVPTSEGRTADFVVDYGLNMCRDGSPPTEGMDLEQTSPILEGFGRSE